METENLSPGSEKNRKFEADLSAYLMNDKKIAVNALFSPQKIGQFFSVGASTVTNWQARYENFPTPLFYVSKIPVFDIREVAHWWIHWTPVNRTKSGALPENWRDYLG